MQSVKGGYVRSRVSNALWFDPDPGPPIHIAPSLTSGLTDPARALQRRLDRQLRREVLERERLNRLLEMDPDKTFPTTYTSVSFEGCDDPSVAGWAVELFWKDGNRSVHFGFGSKQLAGLYGRQFLIRDLITTHRIFHPQPAQGFASKDKQRVPVHGTDDPSAPGYVLEPTPHDGTATARYGFATRGLGRAYGVQQMVTGLAKATRTMTRAEYHALRAERAELQIRCTTSSHHPPIT